MVLITDGEDLENNWPETLRELQKEKITVFTVGVGIPGGAPIPILDKDGKTADWKKDAQGNIVKSRLDEGTLIRIASDCQGQYYRLSAVAGIEPFIRILQDIRKETAVPESQEQKDRPLPISPAAGRHAAGCRNGPQRQENSMAKKADPDFAASISARAGIGSSPPPAKTRKASRPTGRANSPHALQDFLSAKGVKPDSPELKNNTASALYELKKYKEALDEFSRLDPGRAAAGARPIFITTWATAYYRLGQFPQALENYKKSLLQNPDDVHGKKNFELTLKKIQEQKQKQDQKQQPQDQKNQQQEQQQQQQKQKYERHDAVPQPE